MRDPSTNPPKAMFQLSGVHYKSVEGTTVDDINPALPIIRSIPQFP